MYLFIQLIIMSVVYRYKDLLNQAKAVENSWGRDTDHLEAIEEELKDISQRVDRDGRILNPNVHYNEGENAFTDCTAAELEPAVEAYRDLYELLWCDTYDSCISVAKEGFKTTNVRCNCSETNINLKKNT